MALYEGSLTKTIGEGIPTCINKIGSRGMCWPMGHLQPQRGNNLQFLCGEGIPTYSNKRGVRGICCPRGQLRPQRVEPCYFYGKLYLASASKDEVYTYHRVTA